MKQPASFLTKVLVSTALFLGGAWGGLLYVQGLDDGVIASGVGLLLLPIAFMTSLGAFTWTNFLARAGRAARKRSLAAGDGVSASKGAFITIPVCLIVGLIGGLIVGVSASATGAGQAETISPIGAAVRLGLLGLVYGISLWLLLRANLVAIPED